MEKVYKFIAVILVTVFPAFAFSQMIRTEYNFSYIPHHHSDKKETRKEKINYEKYDANSNLIEEGEYGEIKHFRTVKKINDTSSFISIGHRRDYKNLNNVKFNKYDNSNHLIENELWHYIHNKKGNLIYKTEYVYNSKGQLIKETEFDWQDKISRTKSNEYLVNRITSIDTVYNLSIEGITRVDGESRDTTYLDSLNRPAESFHFYNGKFLYRQKYVYEKSGLNRTELRYDDNPNNLWCVTEYKYDKDDNILQKYWKVIGGFTESKQVYIYDKNKRLIKILNYDAYELTGINKFKYHFD